MWGIYMYIRFSFLFQQFSDRKDVKLDVSYPSFDSFIRAFFSGLLVVIRIFRYIRGYIIGLEISFFCFFFFFFR